MTLAVQPLPGGDGKRSMSHSEDRELRSRQPPEEQPPQQPGYQRLPGHSQPGYPPPGYPPAGDQQGPRPWPRKRHRLRYAVLGALGVLVLIIVIATAVSGGGGGTSPTTASNPTGGGQANYAAASTGGQANSAAASIGTPARDGRFQFTVTSVTYANTVGGTCRQFESAGRGRHFALLHVTVKNIGSQSHAYDDDSSQLVFAHGRKFSASTMADIEANATSVSGRAFLNDIKPGNTVHGVIAFDMPAKLRPGRAELHDSMFSNGVTVSLLLSRS